MRFTHDRRGQSVVIGTVILFGFLILALSLYQVQVVPQENSDIEFEHSQQVEGEFLDVRNAVLSASRTGDGRSTSLKLGTRYPQRTFALNPPPASGQLSTSDPSELRIENATVEGDENVVTYWENRTMMDGAIAFNTRSLRYSPGYNEFRNGPDLVYEHSLVAAEFDTTVLARSEQTAFGSDRNRIRLTALNGTVDESGVERTSLDPEALSQSRRSVTLNSADGDPIVLELPTDISMDRAAGLEQQWDDRLGDDAEVTVASGTVRIELSETETYRLELGKVGLGSGTTAPNESNGYITKVSSNNGVAVAEVRDRFNNPVEDAEVEIDVNDDGTVDQTILTDEEGRVEYEVNTVNTVSDVEMHINGASEDDPDWESVLFTDLGTADGPSSDFERVYNVSWNDPGPLVAGTTPEVNGTVRSNGELLDNATVDFATNSSIAIFQGENTSTTTVDGNFTTNLTTIEEGTATLFAASGDDVDQIQIDVIDPADPVPFGVFVQGESSLGQNGNIDADFEVDSGSEVFSFDVNVDRRGNSGNYDGTVIIDGGAFNNAELTLTGAAAADLGTGNEIDLLNPDIYDSVNNGDLQSISDQLDSNSAAVSLNNQGSVDLEQPDVRKQ